MSDPLRIRRELRQLGPKVLFRLVQRQRLGRCILGGICPFLIQHKGYNFCVSELLDQGCEKERALAFKEEEEKKGFI